MIAVVVVSVGGDDGATAVGDEGTLEGAVSTGNWIGSAAFGVAATTDAVESAACCGFGDGVLAAGCCFLVGVDG